MKKLVNMMLLFMVLCSFVSAEEDKYSPNPSIEKLEIDANKLWKDNMTEDQGGKAFIVSKNENKWYRLQITEKITKDDLLFLMNEIMWFEVDEKNREKLEEHSPGAFKFKEQ